MAPRPTQTAFRGFTLIELIAAILIIGILAALAGPTFFDTLPFTERGYADEVASAMRTAQKIAVASGSTVSFSIDANGYRVTQRAAQSTSCTAPWPNAVTLSDGSTLAGTSPTGVTVGSTQFAFDANGNVCGGAAVAVTIGSKPFTVTVQSAGGLVQVL